MRKYNSGINGEKKVEYLLKPLEHLGYKIIHNIKLPMKNGRKIELDFIIIGINGIFIVEVKNLQGNITGNTYNKYLERILPDKNISQDIKNPIIQVKKQARYLTDYLEKNNIFLNVNYIIVFPNENVQLNLTGDTSNIIQSYDSYKICNSINMYPVNNTLSEYDINNIYIILNKLM